jgi:3alpha(or 20beta)-hydroxysteroid dehydrogenase
MSKNRLEGKVALISGGARGMGAVEAELFVSEGAKVMITDVREEEGQETARRISADGSQCLFMRHDVTNELDWDIVVSQTVQTFGRLDILINNAGIFEAGTTIDTKLDDFKRTTEINQYGVFLGMKSVADVMMKQKSGSIINLSSIAGLQGAPGFIAYAASKWAVRGMTKSAARELAPFGIRVNSIHPGLIDTLMLKTIDDLGEGIRAQVEASIPWGREGEAIEIARMALFLASDESSYATGAEFVVDGGRTA